MTWFDDNNLEGDFFVEDTKTPTLVEPKAIHGMFVV